MPLGLTYDLQTDVTDERQAEFDPPQTIQALRQALESLGYPVVPLGNAFELIRAPERLRGVELVFNIAEGIDGRCREAWVPNLLDLTGVPYVGSDPLALSLGLDKVMTKRLAVAEGLSTPRWMSIEQSRALPQALALSFPLIVKPRFEGSGRGIDAEAVVHNQQALRERVEWLYQRCQQPILIEEFLAGGELTVCVIGNDPPVALPAIQRPLDPATRLSCHVVKQHVSSPPHQEATAVKPWRNGIEARRVVQDATPPPPIHWCGGTGVNPWCGGSRWECPVTLEESLDRDARHMALTMFQSLGCRDVARVDLRIDTQGRPAFLEINPLPSFDPEGSFGLIAEYLGLTYTQLIGRVLAAALQRTGSSITPACRAASDAVLFRLRIGDCELRNPLACLSAIRDPKSEIQIASSHNV